MKLKEKQARKKRREQKRRRRNLKRQRKCSYCKARIGHKPKHITYSKGHFKKLGVKQKRVTILIGAGAVASWGSCSSAILKDLIQTNTTYITKTGKKPVGKYIFEKLESYFDNNSEVNFETFLAVLESIHDYIMDNTAEGKNPNFNSFNPTLFKFTIEDNDIQININELKGEVTLTNEREFFFELWKHYLKLVVDKIAEYSENILNEKYSSLNNYFRNFIKYYKDRKYIVRIYTTNYDRLVPEIFKNYQKIFDGFIRKQNVGGTTTFIIDADRIYSDRYCLNYFNLHGSIYWKRCFTNLAYAFELTPNDPGNYIEPVSAQSDNPGHQHIPTNIIAGYSKLQRASIQPFNLFLNSFYCDCKESDEIVTIGYSFSDFHINNILSQKFSHRQRKNIHISFEKGEPIGENKVSIYKAKREYKTFESICGNNEFRSSNPKWLISPNAKIYLDGFESFLEEEEYRLII